MELVGNAGLVEGSDKAFGLIVLTEHLDRPGPFIRLREHVAHNLLRIEPHARFVCGKRHIQTVAMDAQRIVVDSLLEDRSDLVGRLEGNVGRADRRLRPEMTRKDGNAHEVDDEQDSEDDTENDSRNAGSAMLVAESRRVGDFGGKPVAVMRRWDARCLHARRNHRGDRLSLPVRRRDARRLIGSLFGVCCMFSVGRSGLLVTFGHS